MKRILTVAALGIGSFTQAQLTPPVGDTASETLDQVVITANKFPVKQSQTGKVITVITRQQLDRSGGKTLGQVLTEQAGINISGALNNLGTNQTIFTRGASGGRTLITIDGVPVYDASSITNEFDINLLDLNTIEQVEVCKGAQSTLYGSDAEAGVINIITIKKDITKPLGFKGSLAGGNRGTFRGSGQLYGKMANTVTYHLRYSRLYTDGFSTAADSKGDQHFDKDKYAGNAVTGNIVWQATPEMTIKSFSQYSRYKTGVDAGAFADDKDYTSTSQNRMLGGSFVYKLPAVTVTGNYLYNDGKRGLLNDSSDKSAYLDAQYRTRTQLAELYASIYLGKGFTLLQGADHRYAAMNQSSLSISSFGLYQSFIPDTSVSQTSLYSSLFYIGSFGLNAELGGRLNTHSRYGSNYTYTFNPSFVIKDKVKLLASISGGFKAPTLYQIYNSNEKLQPEASVTYEAGVQAANSRVSGRAVFFSRRITAALDYNNRLFQYYNINKQKVHGLEVENTVKLTAQLSLSLNYTWLKAKEWSQSRLNFRDTVYRYALRRPEHTVNASLSYIPLSKLFVSVAAHFESSRMDAGGYKVPDVKLNNFCILNAYASYDATEKIRIFADAKNVTDKKFVTIYGYNAIPFLLCGGASFNF